MKLGKYETNNIYCEDSYEAVKNIPDKSVDLIVTDPPYELDNIGSKKNSISKTFANCNSQIKPIGGGIRLDILEEFMRIMKKPNIYIWCNKKQIPDYLNFFYGKYGCSFEIMTWCKTNPTPLCGGNYLIDKEFCLYFRKGVRLNTTFDTAFTYWVSSKNKLDKDRFLHPTCKPIEIINNLIINSSNENEIVADFFLGSGTTAVACKNLNRQYIGFEINEEFYNIAKNRLDCVAADGQQTLFLL